jgi:hypothetical protein
MTSVNKPKMTFKPDFSAFLPEMIDKIQQVSNIYLESYNEHEAFVYLVAELFETTSEDRFTFTDGQKDGGIDFVVKDSPVYTIGQCKFPVIEGLKNSTKIPTFDHSGLQELLAAVSMLQDKSGGYEVKPVVRRLRGDYQRDLEDVPEETHLTAILAIFGQLSTQAYTEFEASKAILKEQNVDLRLIDWTDIHQAIHAPETPSDVAFNIRLNYESQDNLLAHENYCYVLARAFDFYEAFTDYGWALFDWNVRFQLSKSPINKRIVGTLQKARGRKNFHHYNNGLLITCKSYKNDKTRQRLTLSGPQIINGCQTVRSICEAYDSLTPVEQQDFRERTWVQVKIIRTTDLDFIGELVLSTNDQNPMKPRNLKSNSSEQRSIQRNFKNIPKSWFYQRKDGEFQSLISSTSFSTGFRKSDYSVGYKKYRMVDNEDLAKVWYSFTGHSERALRGGVDFFADGEEGAYKRIFQSVPTTPFWSAFSEPTYLSNSQFFESGVPTPHQYLLAYSIGRYVDSRRISFRVNRENAISRGIKNGELKGDLDTGMPTSTAREIDEYLSKDFEYFQNIMLNNSREIIIELYAFIICLKYTSFDAMKSLRILTNLTGEFEYLETGLFDSSSIKPEQDGNNLYGPIYSFIDDCFKQYYFEYQAEIKAAPRLKSYLAQRTTINRLRGLLVRRDSNIALYDALWKITGKSFLESLPNLS